MSLEIHKLSGPRVRRLSERGRYGDGGGLYLQVSANGARSWIYRFSIIGRRREMGLGSERIIDLRTARERARVAGRLLSEGVDPIDAKRADRARRRAKQTNTITFDQAAQRYFDAHMGTWKSDKHRAQWRGSMGSYASPIIGKMQVQAINTAAVLRVVEPIWRNKTETATRVRNRIETVLDWATARGHRLGPNPARWVGHLDKILPPKTKVRKVVHYPALPYREVAPFMAELGQTPSVAAAALQFLILTATRTNETLGARWEEINFEGAAWTIPASRMKAGREHRIPLSDPALAILEIERQRSTAPYVFAGSGKQGRLGDISLLRILKQLGRPELTAHGFRSTFRDWAAEETDTANEVVEMALAHAVSEKVEAAYRRGDLFEKRRMLMIKWSSACKQVR